MVTVAPVAARISLSCGMHCCGLARSPKKSLTQRLFFPMVTVQNNDGMLT
jgi:hypothetical protein